MPKTPETVAGSSAKPIKDAASIEEIIENNTYGDKKQTIDIVNKMLSEDDSTVYIANDNILIVLTSDKSKNKVYIEELDLITKESKSAKKEIKIKK